MSKSAADKPTDSEKLQAALAELEAERQRRIQSGKWGRAAAPALMAIPETGETLRTAQDRALAENLELHPDSPRSLHAYSWIEIQIVDPAPTIELPEMQYAPDHIQAVDVTPSPGWRPPMPPPAPPRAAPTRRCRIDGPGLATNGQAVGHARRPGGRP